MSKVAVFVDAGYFWVQAGYVAHGAKSSRDHVSIDYAALRQEVLDQASAQFPNADLLRVYWYDGPGSHGAKTLTHLAIDELDDFKLRLGTRNGVGDQKAVDGLIIADLIGLAQSKAIVGAIVLSGDADLTPGVIAAQSLGIRVHLLSMGPVAATSPYLRAEVDHKAHWADPVVQKFASANSPKIIIATPEVAQPACSTTPSQFVEANVFADVANDVMTQTGSAISLENGQLPKTIDGKLLWFGKQKLGRILSESEKRELRNAFKELLRKK